MKKCLYRVVIGITTVWMSLALCSCGEEPVAPVESTESTSTVDQEVTATTSATETQVPSETETTTTMTTTATTAKPTNPTATKTTKMPTETTTTTTAKKNEVGQTKTNDEFTVTLKSFQKVGDSYVAELVVACDASALDDHELLAKERLWIVDATKHRAGITTIVDDKGENLMGKTLPKGGTQYMKVTFKPDGGFIPITFSYVYDTRGFREIRFSL